MCLPYFPLKEPLNWLAAYLWECNVSRCRLYTQMCIAADHQRYQKTFKYGYKYLH